MRRHAEDATGADHGTRSFGRKIVLADMYAFEFGSDADVGAVVHDQRHAFAERVAKLASMAQHLARGANLVAILNEGRTAGGEFPGIVHDGTRGAQRRSKTGNINDGVELG